MSEKRFTIEESENQLIIFDNGVSDETYFHLGNDERDVRYVCDLLNELAEENENLKLKIVSLENEVQRQRNELKNTRKEFTKKTEELNWLKSEDYLKKIY
ncbi:MAG: hypothetical protein IJI96_03465 [Methanobrevibacter sp.]|nr:hypothetical protein [Methanobrevibacter sp.]